MNNISVCAAALLVLPTLSVVDSYSQLSVNGYRKSFAVCSWPPELSGLPPVPATWSLHNALRLKLNWTPSEPFSFNLAYGLAPQIRNPAAAAVQNGAARRYRVDDVRTRLYPWAGDGDGHFTVHHNLDRAYVRLSRGPADLFIGRQAVAWGSARVVNPTDVIAPYPFTELDTEERIGVDALKAVFQAGGLSYVEAGAISGRGFRTDSSAFFLRFKTHWCRTDIAPCLAVYRGNLMSGLDLAGSLGGVGTWAETAFTRYRRDAVAAGIKEAWRLSAGCDIRFSESVYAFIEYHFNGDGEAHPEGYWRNAFKAGYRDGPVYLMGRHYLILSLAWQLTPLLTASFMPMTNLGDQSLLLAQSFEFNVSQDSYLSAGTYLPFGGKTDLAGPVVTINSEYGGYPLTLYISYGLYF